MAVKNQTVWTPPSGRGYVKSITSDAIQTQSSINITDQSGNNLTIQAEKFVPVYATGWGKTTKKTTSWQPLSGQGYIKTIGNLLFTDNSGRFIITNSGNNIVTNPTIAINKYLTQWTASGA